MHLNNKILSLLGFCRKAGKLIVGTQKVTELINSGVSCLVVLSSDISQKTEKEMKFIASKHKAVVIRINEDTNTVAHSTGTTAGIVATADEGFCKAILQGGNNI